MIPEAASTRVRGTWENTTAPELMRREIPEGLARMDGFTQWSHRKVAHFALWDVEFPNCSGRDALLPHLTCYRYYERYFLNGNVGGKS